MTWSLRRRGFILLGSVVASIFTITPIVQVRAETVDANALTAAANEIPLLPTKIQVSGTRAENITASGAQVRWSSDQASDSQVAWGSAAGSYSQNSTWRCDAGGLVTEHCVNLTGLTPGTTFNYQVRSVAEPGSDGVSENFTFTSAAPASPPAQPTNLQASLGDSRINLRWQDNASNENEYRIMRRATGGTWTSYQTLSADTASWTDNSVTAGATYEYMIAACGSVGCSVASNTASATVPNPTTANVTSTSATVATYTNISAATQTTTTVAAGSTGSPQVATTTAGVAPTLDLRVDGAKGSVTRSAPANYMVTWVTTGNPASCTGSGTWGGSKSIPSGSWNFLGVTVPGSKIYTLTCTNPYGSVSDTVQVDILAPTTTATTTTTLPPPDTTPPVLTGVPVAYVTGAGAQIKWFTNEPSDSQVGFGTSAGNYGSYSNMRCDAGGLVGTHCIYLTGLAQGTTYYYRAISRDAANNPAAAPEQTFVTPALTTASTSTQQIATTTTAATTTAAPPAPPTNLNVLVSTAGYNLELRWQDTSSNESHFAIWYRPVGQSWVMVGTSPMNTTLYLASKPTVGNYDYKVTACNSAGCSGDSNYAPVAITSTVSTTTSTIPTISTILPFTTGVSPTVTLRVNGSYGPLSFVAPAAYTISWVTTGNPTSCQPEGDWGASGAAYVPSGSRAFSDITALGPKTYTITCKNAYGSASDTVVVNIIAAVATTPVANIPTHPAPETPTELTVEMPTTGSLTLRWRDNASGETSFRIWYRRSSSANWILIGVTPANRTLFLASRPAAGSYDYKINACDSKGCSADSNIVSIDVPSPAVTVVGSEERRATRATPEASARRESEETGQATTATLPPGASAPTVEIKVDGGHEAITKTAPANYALTWTTTGNPTACQASGTWSGTRGFPKGSWAFQGVSVLGPKTYTLTCKNAYGSSSDTVQVHILSAPMGSEERRATRATPEASARRESEETGLISTVAATSTAGVDAPIAPSIPQAPSGLTTAQVPNYLDVKLQWQDNSDNESHFKIMRRDSRGIWAYVGIASAQSTGLVVRGNPLGPIDFSVAACNNGGCSEQSSVVQVIVQAPTDTGDTAGKAPVVSILVDRVHDTVTRVAPAEYTLTWTASNDPTTCMPGGVWEKSGNKTVPSGSWTFRGVTAPGPKIYTLNCTNAYGVGSDTVAVNILPAAEPRNEPIGSPAGEISPALPPPTEPIKPAPEPEPGSLVFSVTDATGQAVPSAGVHVYRKDYKHSFNLRIGAGGSAEIKLPVGKYVAEVFPPADMSGVTKPDPVELEIKSQEIAKMTARLMTNNNSVTGKISFADGRPVADAEVGAYSLRSRDWRSVRTNERGEFTLQVGAGSWQMGVRPIDPQRAAWQPAPDQRTVDFGGGAKPETQVVNLIVRASNIKVLVRAVDSLGAPLSEVGLVLDQGSAAGGKTGNTGSGPEYRRTEPDGTATYWVAPGRYFLRGKVPPGRDLTEPAEREIDIVSDAAAEFTLTFPVLKKEQNVTLRGTTRLEDGTPTAALIYAWSENGGSLQVNADENGIFSMLLPDGTVWRLGARKSGDRAAYKSSEVSVTVEKDKLVDIVLVKEKNKELAPSVTVADKASSRVVVQTQDGATATVPPNAAADSGRISVEMKPTVEAPVQASAKVVSTVYDIAIKNQQGKNVSQLSDEVEIKLPYDPQELAAQGVTEDTLKPSYYDESAGEWIKLENFTIDKTRHVVIARVKHLTRFALVAPADVVPPSAPAEVRATFMAQRAVLLAWNNPASDFRHAKVYRSNQSGSLGTVLFPEIRGEAQAADANVSPGAKYFYTVRAVDPAGNESTNIDQVAVVVPTAPSSMFTAAAFGRILRFGSWGEDVKALQDILRGEQVYSGQTTGYFGKLTRQGVVAFQEKYAEEILAPVDLVNGSGVVGRLTRQKLNQLLGQ
ncbi:MAG: hypothetical protein HY978_01925 [Candidatus Liptonbacteria bacterium]|nr:hypothetical protein [Candidatus Liptonbacteria bacterium]